MQKTISNKSQKWIFETIEQLKSLNFFIEATNNWKAYSDWRYEHSKEIENLHLYFTFGATKICIINALHRDWVLKVNFNDNIVNYCELEAFYYNKACCNNLEDYFAATYKVYTFDRGDLLISVFAQEYAAIDEDIYDSKCVSYLSKPYYERIDEIPENELEAYYEQVSELDDNERIYAIYANDDATDNLIEFITENHINDLHSKNWGTTEDNRFVMIDFSGFRG